MKRYVKIESQPVCPFLGGKPCIKDGWKFNAPIQHPCAFYDADKIYNGVSPDEPCRIKRAVNKILSDEVQEQADNEPIEIPY